MFETYTPTPSIISQQRYWILFQVVMMHILNTLCLFKYVLYTNENSRFGFKFTYHFYLLDFIYTNIYK